MFDYTDGTPAALKAEIWQIIIELKSTSGLNSDIQFDYGYMDGEKFVKVGNKTRHLRSQRTLDLINVIRSTSTDPKATEQEVEDYLVMELEKEPDVEPEPQE